MNVSMIQHVALKAHSVCIRSHVQSTTERLGMEKPLADQDLDELMETLDDILRCIAEKKYNMDYPEDGYEDVVVLTSLTGVEYMTIPQGGEDSVSSNGTFLVERCRRTEALGLNKMMQIVLDEREAKEIRNAGLNDED